MARKVEPKGFVYVVLFEKTRPNKGLTKEQFSFPDLESLLGYLKHVETAVASEQYTKHTIWRERRTVAREVGIGS